MLSGESRGRHDQYICLYDSAYAGSTRRNLRNVVEASAAAVVGDVLVDWLLEEELSDIEEITRKCPR
jgi:hypothetical protein